MQRRFSSTLVNLFFAEVQPTFALFSVAKLMKKSIAWKEICKKVTNELHFVVFLDNNESLCAVKSKMF